MEFRIVEVRVERQKKKIPFMGKKKSFDEKMRKKKKKRPKFVFTNIFFYTRLLGFTRFIGYYKTVLRNDDNVN